MIFLDFNMCGLFYAYWFWMYIRLHRVKNGGIILQKGFCWNVEDVCGGEMVKETIN